MSFTVVLTVAFLTFARVNLSMRTDLAEATASLVEEQHIADRLARAVMRQLVAASNFAGYRDPDLIGTFRAAGDDAYAEMRRYLFRDLTPAQRLQLEGVREQHQRLEVAASQAFEFFDAGRTEEAVALADVMVEHAMELQGAVDAFLQLREADLDRLSAQQAATFRYISAGVGLLAVFMLLGITFLARFLHQRLGQPIASLTDAATAIERGDYNVRVEVPHDDEFAEVGDAFNRMADSLAKAKADIEDRNRQLQAALDELKATQAELVQSEKMSATGRMMAGLAHELNNPLASVLGYGELLRSRLEEGDPPTPGELHEAVAPIVSEAVRARDLVRNLLRFSRRPEGGVGAVSLGESLEIVVGLRRYAFEQAGLQLIVEDVPDGCVRAEGQRLQQVLLNIINNALDAMTPAGEGTLRIRAEKDGETVVVEFEDTGPGFDEPGRALEPFYTTKAVGAGTGLGLSLVHRFMDTFGGRVQVENRPEGGARVVLTFLSAEPDDPATTPAEPAATPAVDRPAARILVVEDEAPLRNLQRRMLTRVNAHVLLASAGHEAIRLLETEDVDLVVSDVKMPGASGLQLFHWVKEHQPRLVDRFLFVTGDVGDPEIVSFAEAEPERFIRKPFQMSDYLERIAAALR
ncbi:MAG: ATP-binding protein [Longimicrobiales bacterium]